MRRGRGLVSPGWNLRLVPSTVPAVGSASPTSSPGSAGLPDRGPAMEHTAVGMEV